MLSNLCKQLLSKSKVVVFKISSRAARFNFSRPLSDKSSTPALTYALDEPHMVTEEVSIDGVSRNKSTCEDEFDIVGWKHEEDAFTEDDMEGSMLVGKTDADSRFSCSTQLLLKSISDVCVNKLSVVDGGKSPEKIVDIFGKSIQCF